MRRRQVEYFFRIEFKSLKYNVSRLYAIHSDLSPNLSPKRREALNFTPLPLQGRGWGLGLYWTQLRSAIALVSQLYGQTFFV
ncbi:hypothetical protein CK516_14635 [Nostoc sp. 'Peltigera malacea cyanobiont' DB3992]|nr:hypothetical protein CK516_14635 [Nostoc sp. 'Peltigera malacea cyanobiont' DB3992]